MNPSNLIEYFVFLFRTRYRLFDRFVRIIAYADFDIVMI